jgi:hypothetical protein
VNTKGKDGLFETMNHILCTEFVISVFWIGLLIFNWKSQGEEQKGATYIHTHSLISHEPVA